MLGQCSEDELNGLPQEVSISNLETTSITHTYKISDLLGNYIQDLKTIKRPRVSNSEQPDGVDRVSRNIEGRINLAESTLHRHHVKVPQPLEQSSPWLDRTGDIFLGTDRVHASLADCIKLAEDTLHAEGYKERIHNGLKTYWKPKESQTRDYPSRSKGTSISDLTRDDEFIPQSPDWTSD